MIVYVDNRTQMLNSKLLAMGLSFRFNGLLFNDSGTLRMDAAQINDGGPRVNTGQCPRRARKGPGQPIGETAVRKLTLGTDDTLRLRA